MSHSEKVLSNLNLTEVTVELGFDRTKTKCLFLSFAFILFSNLAFSQIFESTHLPLIVIQTENDQSIIDEPRIKADMQIIFHENGENKIGDTPNIYDGKIAIELRGQSSQSVFDKKSYRLETQDENGENNNVALLGMPSENDWILSGPYSDKTLIRNVLIYELSRKIGRYAARTRICELVINDDYLGVFILMENIKRDKNRVAISKLDEDDIDGDSLTGGYIFRIDKSDPLDVNIWSSERTSLTGKTINYQVVYPKPDDLQHEQWTYLTELMHEFERAIYLDNYQGEDGFRKFIDEDSFIDYFLLNELARNPDAYRISTYFHKDRDDEGGKINVGPIWDFNLGFGNVNFCAGSSHEDWILNYHNYCPDDSFQVPAWWDRLFSDPAFSQKAINRWKTLRSGILSTSNICGVVDSLTTEIGEAEKRNFERWAVLGEWIWPNDFVGRTYNSEVNYLKTWLRDRLEWVDENIETVSSGVEGSPNKQLLNVFPNPFWEDINLKIQTDVAVNYQFNLVDVTGKKIHDWQITVPAGQLITTSLSLDSIRLARGMYFLQILENDRLVKTEKLWKVL